MGRLINLKDFDESQFWKRLGEYPGDKTMLDDLKASVRKVAEQAKYISSLICRYLPQYTLHNETHSLNVLAIMDALVPKEVMKQLTPLECALCIIAAYTHDLGMALTEDEYRKIFDETQDTPERRRFLRYRDGFGEELRQIERWRKKGGPEAERRINLIKGHILASYIRETHTNEDVNRVERWLDEIAETARNERLFVYGNYDFKHDLALIDISHGKSTRWLREQFPDMGRNPGFYKLVGIGEWVNIAFPGLLLRLADIMDFDASRAPRILFKHIGIESEKSILEWNKHLSVVGWDLHVRPKDPRLIYAAQCEHPVYEKSIREFARWINQELRDAREELAIQLSRLDEEDRRFELHLPAEVELEVCPKGSPHEPIYIYEDIQFRLNQDEIQQLFLGESLWGDPQLCIRELLQNALDALQMRDLRLKLQKRGEKPFEPVDPLSDGEELRVVLTWGHDEDSGQDYILVKDNGIGMTRDVIVNYFTQIGKSFYRSADFERERKFMAEKKLLATPISIFGIGILSFFMIGDRLHVRTRPGGANDSDRRAYDITISGPGSLFWLKEGTLEHKGTEVKVFLKSEYSIKHEPEHLLDRLRKHFGYKMRGWREEEDRHIINPALTSASHVVWPLYPVLIQPPEKKPIIRIDDHFHLDVMNPLDKTKLIKEANEWGCPESYIGEPEWGIWDWTDPSTGSRIRFWFPHSYRAENGSNLPIDPPEEKGLCRQDELSAFVESKLSKEWQSRTVITVKGMYVDDIEVCRKELELTSGVGGKVWIDLRGGAAPRVTIDRRTALEPENADQWRDIIHRLFMRAVEVIKCEVKALSPSTAKNVLLGFPWHEVSLFEDCFNEQIRVFNLLNACAPGWKLNLGDSIHLLNVRLYLSLKTTGTLARDVHDSYYDLALDFTLDSTSDNAPDRKSSFAFLSIFCYAFARALDLAFDLDRDLYDDLDDINRHYHLYEIVGPDPYSDYLNRNNYDLYDNFVRKRSLGMNPAFRECFFSSTLQEAFWPDLSRSFPIFNLFHLRGKIGDAMLTGPGLVEFDLESDSRTVHPVDLEGKCPEEVTRFEYDLVFPMTAVPLGQLRARCPEWRSDRRYRLLGIAPFLFPCLDKVWFKHYKIFSQLFKVNYIFALLPRIELWSKPFAKWTDEDWQTCGFSALWDIKSKQVLWAKGAHHVDEMRSVGKPIETFVLQETIIE